MKEKWVIANWKMNLGLMASAKLAKILSKKYSDHTWFSKVLKKDINVNVVVCPSYTATLEVAKFLQKSSIHVGAQDMFWHERGAFTGEVSPLMLMEIGVDYVILGHSERRQYLDESDKHINKKIRAALHYGLVPVLCIGENLDERSDGRKEVVVLRQLNNALEDIKLSSEKMLIVAYEPIWAIGTGRAVDPTEAEEMHSVIRQHLYELYDESIVNDNIKIIYGGSVTAENVAQFTRKHNIDGVLVGGASLKSADFLQIIDHVKKN